MHASKCDPHLGQRSRIFHNPATGVIQIDVVGGHSNRSPGQRSQTPSVRASAAGGRLVVDDGDARFVVIHGK